MKTIPTILSLLCILSNGFGQSSKTLMVGATNNVLPPSETNFFQANSILLNAAVTGGGGGSATNATLLNGIAGQATLLATNVSGPNAGLNLSVAGGSLSLTCTNVPGGITNSNTTRVTLSNDLSVTGDGITWPLSVTPNSAFGGLATFGGYVWFQVSGATLDSGAITTDGSGNMRATSFTGSGAGLSGAASGLNIGGNAATATTATNLAGNISANQITSGAVGRQYLPLATNGLQGVVQPDGSTITANGAGVLSVNFAAITEVPATAIDSSVGYLTLTNVYHDYQSQTNGSMSNGGTNLTGGPFTASDVGKEVDFNTGANQLATTITSYSSSTQVGLAAPYSASVNNIFYGWGHDDSAAINAAIVQAMASNIGTIIVPSGQYFLNTWTQLVRSAGFAQINVVFTNLDLVSNSSRTIGLVGVEAPAPNMNWTATGKQPISTNGAIFNCMLAPVSGQGGATCIIGCPLRPANMSWGFVGENLVLKNLTFRAYPTPGYSAINAAYIGQVDFEHLSVDVGVDLSYVTAPTSSPPNFAICFPVVNNWAKSVAEDLVVQGYDIGYGISEHLKAGDLTAELCLNGIQFLTGNHASSIVRFGCWATVTHMWNNNVQNCTKIGEYDAEIDLSAAPSWAAYGHSLYDPSNTQHGRIDYAASSSSGAWIAITNSGGTNVAWWNLHNNTGAP